MEVDRLEPTARKNEPRAFPEQDRHSEAKARSRDSPWSLHRIVWEPSK